MEKSRWIGKSLLFVKNCYMRASPKLKTFYKFARVELPPPHREDFPEIVEHAKRLFCGTLRGNWRNLTIMQAWLNTLVASEVLFWFFIGECLGKRNFVGYKV
ncbi:ATP synthase subunit [Sergentomyia squamirostris]